MRLYHGSTVVIESPDVAYSKNNLDFGRGFYLTSHRQQAERWARRKAVRSGGKAVVNAYELDDQLDGFKILEFPREDEAWVEFVCDCRRGGDEYKQYDIVIGGVADDKVFAAVDMYYRGIWDIHRTIDELKYYETNDQYCVISQKLLDEKLGFVESYEVT